MIELVDLEPGNLVVFLDLRYGAAGDDLVSWLDVLTSLAWAYAHRAASGQARGILADGEPAGLVTTHHFAGILALDGLFVAGPLQRRGVGTAVLSLLVGEASRSHRGVLAHTSPGERAMQALLHRAGLRRLFDLDEGSRMGWYLERVDPSPVVASVPVRAPHALLAPVG